MADLASSEVAPVDVLDRAEADDEDAAPDDAVTAVALLSTGSVATG